MNVDVPQRSLTREEVNRCYLRWQQLRNEHGENAPNVPEFIYFTKVLQLAAKQQQQQQQHHKDGQIKNQNSVPDILPDNGSQGPIVDTSGRAGNLSPKSRIAANNMSSVASPHMNNGPSNMQNVPVGNSPANYYNKPAGASNPNLAKTDDNQAMKSADNVTITPGIISRMPQEKADLLRAQVTALKFLINKQPIPQEFQQTIHNSIRNQPDFKKLLKSLSDSMRLKQLQHQQQQIQQHQVQQMQQISQLQNVPVQQNQGIPMNSNDMHTSTNNNYNMNNVRSPDNEQKLPVQSSNSDNTIRKTSYDTADNSAKSTQHSPNLNNNAQFQAQFKDTPGNKLRQELPERNDSSNKNDLVENANNDNKIISEKPPVFEKPVLLEEYKKSHSNNLKVVSVDNPELMVDTFTLPDFGSDPILYDQLFPSANKPYVAIQPGILPPGLDVHSATELYQTSVALRVDDAVENALATVLRDKESTQNYDQDLYDYYALQLLPLQKAVRGHVLQNEWYRSSLLPNTHPNFLSKFRLLNIQDALITEELYQKNEILQYEKQKSEKIVKLNSIIKQTTAIYHESMDIRAKRIRFGHKLISVHANFEKEEQKRVERQAKERLQALKANDEEAYIKLLDQTKDTRITHLLKQTNAFLDSLTVAVRDQQKHTKAMIESHVADEDENSNDVDMTNENIEEVEDAKNVDYYSVAHKIQEEVRVQPSILIGGTLKEYQLKGLQWMVSLFNNHLNGILADEMGLGKTIQTISLLTYLYETKNVHGPFLVIVPLSTMANWSSEFEKWAPALKTIAFKGSPFERKAKQNAIKAGDFDVVLTTFEYIIKEKALLSKIKWVHMIIDEGHRMKNARSKLSITLNTFYHSDYRLILTGTPLQNNLPELWALLNFVLPKIFNSVKSFDEWFNTPFENAGGQDKIELNEEEALLVIRRLHKVLRPFLLRRLKKDVERELPDKVEKVIKCQMSSLQKVMYEQMLKHKRLFVGDQLNKKMVGLRGFNNQIMQLKKICNHPYVFEAVEDQINPTRETNDDIWRVAGKFELLERVLPKLKATGHRVLIFFQMTQIMDIMEDFLRHINIKYLRLDGHTKADERSELLPLFNQPNSEYFCFILSTRAGGLGLNLQTADTVIIFDTDWNPHQDLQAQDRAHRIGQKNEVRILRLITENSVEEVILEKAHKKLDIDGKVIQAGKFDNKSTAEEQEALLRSLLEAEDMRKKRREEGLDDEEEEMDDKELNELLARNDDELIVFAKLDSERTRNDLEHGITNRLFEKGELPDIYNQDMDAEIEKENSKATTVVTGKRSNRNTSSYSDALTEAQWLKQFEVSDDENEDGHQDKKPKIEETPDEGHVADGQANIQSSEQTDPPTNIQPDAQDNIQPSEGEQFEQKRDETPTLATEEPKSLEANFEDHEIGSDGSDQDFEKTQSNKINSKGKIRVRGSSSGRARGRGRGRGRGRAKGKSSKTGANFIRDPKLATEPIEVRNGISKTAMELYDFAMNYKNKEGRTLSDIFLVKPSKRLYPDYFMLIRYPLAFDSIKLHINTAAYDSIKEVFEDIHLMFSNARVYNHEESVVFHDSLELEQAIEDKYKEMTGESPTFDFTDFDTNYVTAPLIINTPVAESTTPADSIKTIEPSTSVEPEALNTDEAVAKTDEIPSKATTVDASLLKESTEG